MMVRVVGALKLRKKKDVIDFGKYKGQTVKHVFDNNPRYLSWMVNNTNRTDFKKKFLYCIERRCDDLEMDLLFNEMGLGWFDLH